MLADLTSCQYQEILAFFRVEREEREERELIKQDRNIEKLFDGIMAAQEREANG